MERNQEFVREMTEDIFQRYPHLQGIQDRFIDRDVVRMFSFQPVKTIPADADLTNFSFLRAVFAKKTELSSQNPYQVMPAGGGVKHNESPYRAVRREMNEESRSMPGNVVSLGALVYIFEHLQKALPIRNNTHFFVGTHLPSDTLKPINIQEDKMGLSYFDQRALRELFQNGTKTIFDDGRPRNVQLVDHLNLNEADRRKNRTYVGREGEIIIDNIQEHTVGVFNYLEARYKSLLLEKLLDILKVQGKVAVEDYRNFKKLLEPDKIQQLEMLYTHLVRNYGIDRNLLQSCVNLVNLEMEMESLRNYFDKEKKLLQYETRREIGEILRELKEDMRSSSRMSYSKQETFLRAPLLLMDFWNRPAAELDLIINAADKNKHLQNIVEFFQEIGEYAYFISHPIQEHFMLDPILMAERIVTNNLNLTDESEIEGLEPFMSDSRKTPLGTKIATIGNLSPQSEIESSFIESFIRESLEKHLGIKVKNFPGATRQANEFIEYLWAPSAAKTGVNLAHFGQHNEVIQANNALRLVQLATGTGEAAKCYTNPERPQQLNKIRFEAFRKLILMAFASEAMDMTYEHDRKDHSIFEDLIYRKLFAGIERQYQMMAFNDAKGVPIDVCFTEDPELLSNYFWQAQNGLLKIEETLETYTVNAFLIRESANEDYCYEGDRDYFYYLNRKKEGEKIEMLPREESFKIKIYKIYNPQGRLIDICYDSYEYLKHFLERQKKGQITMEDRQEYFKFFNIKDQVVPVYVHSREKDILSVMRKMMERKAGIEDIHDLDGRFIAIPIRSPKKAQEMLTYKFGKNGRDISPLYNTFEDHEVVHDLIREYQHLGGPNFRIVNYKPTPKAGEGLNSESIAGGADLHYSNLYCLYDKPNGHSANGRDTEEVMIFTPTENCSAFAHLLKKKHDDLRYSVMRLLHAIGWHDLYKLLHPDEIYGPSVNKDYLKISSFIR